MGTQEQDAAGSAAEAPFKKLHVPVKEVDAAAQIAQDSRDRQKAARLAAEAQKPTKLRLFVEHLASSGVGRRAYVTITASMPAPIEGATWIEQPAFNAAEAILEHPDLKSLYSDAIKFGCAVAGYPA
jgi:hypothetical protein